MRKRKGRTLTFVTKREAEGVALAKERIAKGTKVYADEASHWDDLEATFPDVGQINYSEPYSADGCNTNQAESYFAHLRRMVSGQHHFVSPRYLYQYATEAAWKEDYRRLDRPWSAWATAAGEATTCSRLGTAAGTLETGRASRAVRFRSSASVALKRRGYGRTSARP